MNAPNSSTPYPCPCCGYEVFPLPPGSFEICPICYWEDDDEQLCDPNRTEGGANQVSLIEAQDNFLLRGWSDERYAVQVSAPLPSDKRAPRWRPIRKGTNDEKALQIAQNLADDQKLIMTCYWLRNR